MSTKPRSTESPLDILLITPDSPFPSESGAALRNWGIIRGLHAAGHRLTLLTFSEAALDADNPLHRFCQSATAISLPRRGKLTRLAGLLLSDKADIETRLQSEPFRESLSRTLATHSYDIIQFSGIELAHYLPLIQAHGGRAKIVYDALNAEAELQRIIAGVDRGQLWRWHKALYSTLQARRIRRFESELCRAVDAVIAVSDEDRWLLAQHKGAPIFVLPNGIFADDYTAPSDPDRQDDLLLFTGKMDYRPNVDAVAWFGDEIMPCLLQRHPALTLRVVGRNPHPRLRNLAADDSIDITGRVASVLPHLHRAAVFVLPMRMGSGTRLKALEAMAAGCAVVSTSIGAAGLNRDMRDAIVIADDAHAFANAVSDLLVDADEGRRLGCLARDLARRHYDWSALMPRLLAAYQAICRE